MLSAVEVPTAWKPSRASGAAGGVVFIACALAMRDSMIPPTINYSTPDPECDLDVTPNVPKARQVNVAISNSSGFGGHNVSIALRRWHG
jgi:3-oxoacyl-[acyl-carrier-protein] synthase II